MFTSAYERARCLARATLPSEKIFAVIAAYPTPSAQIGAKWRGWNHRAAFDLLEDIGVSTFQFECRWMDQPYPSQEESTDEELWEHRAISVTWDQADILIWSQIAHDIGVTPQAPIVSKLLDVERDVVVYPYDDRGMDITALSPAPLLELYSRFDTWLLDSDRLRMSEAFVTRTS